MTVGVYLLKKDAEVVYVGQSRDIERRLTQHRRNKVDFDSFEVVETHIGALKRTEQEYILKYRPPLNGRTNRLGQRVFFDSSGVAKGINERMRDHRKRMREAGLRQHEVWVHEDDAATLKRLVRWVQYKISKDPNYEPRLKDTEKRA